MSATTIELVRLTVKEGYSDEEILAAHQAANAALKAKWSGLTHTALVKLENGEYLAIVEWATREEAVHALTNSGDVAEFVAWDGMTEVVAFDMTDIVDSWTGR
ncbi:MAG TPA: hypothetical protein VNT53_04375 [Pseudolysinimonas sp.]|nr:hypothetical protein [Pseudolysinimonas sp.]